MIVGAGPAGTSTWLHLKKYAPELADHTVLIEKAVFPRHKLCAGGVGVWSEDVLKSLDIDLNIPSLFVTDVEFRFRDQRWIFHSPNRFRMVQRADFDLALARSAVNRGMAFHENEEFIKAKREHNALVVRTSQGQYFVKAIVGADGSLSMVRRSMMRPHPSCLAPTIQISAPVDPQYDTEFVQKKMAIDLSPVDEGLQGYTWHYPCLLNETPFTNHGIANFRFHPGSPKADMKEIFSRELQVRNINKKPDSWSSHPIRWFSPEDPISRPNVILAGDAAGIEPAFGGGIHMALSYGEIAARALIQAFENTDFSFRHYKNALRSHFLGGHIRDYPRLANAMYGGKDNPLSLVRQFYTTDRFARKNLLSLLIGPNSAR